LRVLFIGNSLTAANDLPEMVRALAVAGGQPAPAVRAIAVGGFSLGDHLDRGEAQRAIRTGKWDFVVLQQGPSALDESRADLIRDTRRFSELIRRAAARPALYSVWPSTDRAGDFDRVSESYRLAADDVDGLLLPAGDAWRAAWRHDPDLALYSADGLHPTVAGTYLAALVIYERLYHKTPVGLPGRLTLSRRRVVRVELAPERLERLQKAAAEATALNQDRR
jgi:hypothetical protein